MQQTTDDAKGIAMFWHKYYFSMSCRTKTGKLLYYMDFLSKTATVLYMSTI